MRYGIVGCGMMGQEHIRNIALLAQAEVSAFVEPDPQMAAQTQSLVPGATPCPDLNGLLARNDVDALVIASPNHLHVPQLAGRGPHPPHARPRRKTHRHAPRR
jgi:myo-inositol 2-dehydrogenase/D-chiro-inositol 1-dehydrogenase